MGDTFKVGDRVQFRETTAKRGSVIEVDASPTSILPYRIALDGGGSTWAQRDEIEPEKPKGPVVTETVKRIVPGQYGSVHVSAAQPQAVCANVELGWMGPDVLRAAAATLLELAAALSSENGGE